MRPCFGRGLREHLRIFLYLNAGANPNVRLVSLQEVSLQVEYLQGGSSESPFSNVSNMFQMVGLWTHGRKAQNAIFINSTD